jgi:putative glutamine amidotransferase
MATRPVIGLCAAIEHASWSVWSTEAHLLTTQYSGAVQRAGGIALLLPPDPAAVEDPAPLLDLLDGLILAGGTDIDPASYGQPRHAETVVTCPARDAFEIAMVRAAIARDLPVLGICRGMQLLNVARGGTLLQHLPDSVGHQEHRRVPGSFDGADHLVRLEPGTLAARAAGEQTHATLSHHHQGVDRVGEGLLISGRAELDELPEAIELPGARFVLGVQWHPEADPGSPLVAALVEEARGLRAERAGLARNGDQPAAAAATTARAIRATSASSQT